MTKILTKNPFKSILTTIVKQANELAYAIEKERYNKLTNKKLIYGSKNCKQIKSQTP